LACAASLAAGCQSSAARALSRYEASKDESDIAQVSHEAPAGLPGPSRNRSNPAATGPEVALEAGEKSLQQFYRDRQDKPAHLQRARVSFEAAAKADPTSALAQHRLAIIADLQERFRDSENYYRTALSLDPKNANIAADLGWSFILQERWADAERALNHALELEPNSQIARQHLAKCGKHQESQLAADDRAVSGQMLANRPASVTQQPVDNRAAAQAGNWNPQGAIPQDQMGEYLRHQMSQVDRAGTPPTGQPIAIGPRSTGEVPANGPYQQPLAQQTRDGFPAVQQQAPTGTPYQPPVSNQQPVPIYGQVPEVSPQGKHFSHYEPQQQQRPAGSFDQRAPRPQASNVANMNQPRETAQQWQNGPEPNGIQRTQGVAGSEHPDQAMYQSFQLPPLPEAPAQTVVQQQPVLGPPPSSVPPQNFGQPRTAAEAPQTASSLEKARREAALMGLGLGPGQPFASLEQPADRMSPGSMSQLNGAPFPTPRVYSPDLAPIPDLRQNHSFFEQPAMTPPTNSLGQTLPGGTSSMMTPGTVNDPQARLQQNAVNPASGQMPQLPAPPNVWSQSDVAGGMQGYDQSRRAVDQQVQQTLQNTWAGTPSNFIASPAGGVSMPQPAPPMQMMQESWGRQPIAPEPYHHATPPQNDGRFAPAPLPMVNPSANRTPAAANQVPPTANAAPPTYRDGVVVPEQYGARR